MPPSPTQGVRCSHSLPQMLTVPQLTASPQGHGGHQQQASYQQPHRDAPPTGPAPCTTQQTSPEELKNPGSPQTSLLEDSTGGMVWVIEVG